ncbi:MAG: DUF3592 domain-containing protein [Terracidiphilus sp.]
MFELLKEDYAQRWSRATSWWNLAGLAPFLLLGTISVHSWWNDAQIATRQKTTIGTIDGHDPPNHNRYSYAFFVNGHQFTGWATPGDRDFVIGQQIIVYYDPVDPSENSAYDFGEVNPGGFVFIGFCLLACIFYPFLIYHQRRLRKGSAATPTDF